MYYNHDSTYYYIWWYSLLLLLLLTDACIQTNLMIFYFLEHLDKAKKRFSLALSKFSCLYIWVSFLSEIYRELPFLTEMRFNHPLTLTIIFAMFLYLSSGNCTFLPWFCTFKCFWLEVFNKHWMLVELSEVLLFWVWVPIPEVPQVVRR